MAKDVAFTIKQQLLALARERKEDLNFLLNRYGLERLLYRIGCSDFQKEFILKGAMLFSLWKDLPYRATKDIDLLGYGEPDLTRLENIFKAICQTEVEDDGLVFNTETIRVVRIRDVEEYQGVRIHIDANLGKARIRIQIDVGFGDAVTPGPKLEKFPTLIDLPAPYLRVYPQESVVAEKCQAIVMLGMRNSRMKDYFDLHMLATNYSFDGDILTKAIKATFKRRKTDLPYEVPIGLTEEFANDSSSAAQWRGFVKKSRLESDPLPLQKIIEELHDFLMPLIDAARESEKFSKKWIAGDSWK